MLGGRHNQWQYRQAKYARFAESSCGERERYIAILQILFKAFSGFFFVDSQIELKYYVFIKVRSSN